MLSWRSAQQLTPEHGHRLADQGHARSIDADLHHSAAGRDLVAGQLGASQFCCPEWAEAAMRRAADRILVHANPRSEEPRDEIERA